MASMEQASADSQEVPLAHPQHHGAIARSLRQVCTGALIVGIVATICDWGTLWGLVALGMSQRWAVVPGCLVGLAVQFFGNRNFSFGVRGQVARDLLVRQLWRFSLVEGCTLIVIAVTYNLLRELLHIDYRISRAVVGLFVYWGFSLPLWVWVFSTKR